MDNLVELVHSGEHPALAARVQEAVEWIASKPEGGGYPEGSENSARKTAGDYRRSLHQLLRLQRSSG